ncbi:MAG: pyridoxamine 5'-phosphate oxidase [Bacteroidia bacterium]|nr:pyridoxamine 5'-phosphate oxidase [Bacteroidia bacterium]
MRAYINKLRHDFGKRELTEEMAGNDPLALFSRWFHEAVEGNIPEPNAMVLSTSGAADFPGGRIVLLRNFGDEGFVFYTNYNSRKSEELKQNPRASLLFFWPHHERQVRIKGTVSQQTEAESDVYFRSRPRESQIGAWISEQSKPVESREDLYSAFMDFDRKYEGKEIPRPPFWGGFIVKPVYYEFWQGRPGRLHDRITFSFSEPVWQRLRLAP